MKKKDILKIARTSIGDLFVRNKWDQIVVKEVIDEDQYRRWGDITIEKGDIVIDLGAHIGTFARLAAHYGAKVYCYEPAPENFEMLYKNTKAVANIKREPLAVSNEDAVLLLLDPKRGELHKVVDKKNKRTIEVMARTLDEVLKPFKKVDLLKIDIEGAEYEVLYACKTLDKCRQISMEWHNGAFALAELIIVLEDRGFKTVWLGGNGQWGHIQFKRNI